MDTISKTTRNIRRRISNLKCQIKNSSGFTLIELIVVLLIIGILFTTLTALFNPFAQIQKAQNVTRQSDLNQIKNALDTYFNDKGCYPKSIPFGSVWSSGTTVYMEKVPEDPDCSVQNPGYCYNYQTDSSSCPQWDILYSQMHAPIASGIGGCLVASAGSCLPSPGGLRSCNYCVVSGKLDCNYIGSNPLPTPTVPAGGGGGGGSGGGGGGSPTPIPTGLCGSMNVSACSNGVCNYKGGVTDTCLGCGGSLQCYPDLVCGGTICS